MKTNNLMNLFVHKLVVKIQAVKDICLAHVVAEQILLQYPICRDFFPNGKHSLEQDTRVLSSEAVVTCPSSFLIVFGVFLFCFFIFSWSSLPGGFFFLIEV